MTPSINSMHEASKATEWRDGAATMWHGVSG